MNHKEKRRRNKAAAELFDAFLTAHCGPCLRARKRKRPGWKPLMDSCPRCGHETGRIFAEFLGVWRPEIVEYAQTRDMRCLGSSIDWEDLVREFEMTLARAWYAGFTPGRGNLAHYMWRAVRNTWTRVISTAFRKKCTIEREQARGDSGRYSSGVPAARVTAPLDSADEDGKTYAEQLRDPGQPDPCDALARERLASEVRGRILSQLDPLNQAVFWDLIVNERLEVARFAEEHFVTVAVVRKRMADVQEVVAGVAEEYRDRFAP